MLRTLLRGTALLLWVVATIAVLTLLGCEEIPSKPADRREPDQPRSEPSRLYREIGYEELKERWADYFAVQAVYGGETSASKLHASTAFDSLPPEYVFEDAREYGSCVVFTVSITLRYWVVDPDDPEGGEIVDADHPGAVMREGTRTAHVLDCVGEPASGNRVTEGLFHAATFCEFKDQMHHYVLWVGRFSPELHIDIEEWGKDTPLTTASMSVSPYGIERTWDNAQWVDEAVTETGDTVLWNAAATPEVRDLFGFASLGGADEMRFSIDHSVGVVKVEDNDGAAVIEYTELFPGSPPAAEPEPPATVQPDPPPGDPAGPLPGR